MKTTPRPGRPDKPDCYSGERTRADQRLARALAAADTDTVEALLGRVAGLLVREAHR